MLLGKARAHIGETPYEVTINVGRHVLTADEPKSLGGKDAGPAPFGLLVAALGACTSATLKMYAEKKGWPLTSLDVDLRFLRSHPDGTQRIERILTIGGLDEAQAARLADVAERTPVTLAIKAGVPIATSLAGSPA
ncbi:OsmC family protein [Brevundimonas sp.]|uniref:OsmC family protein n=1 Tax=Brevundimonas sp. TaxID=1871086 RepID=UPI003B001178